MFYDRYQFIAASNIYPFNNGWWTDDPTTPSTYVDQNYIRGNIIEQACPALETLGTVAPTLITAAQLAACNTLTVTPTSTVSATPITAPDATSAHQLMAMDQVPIQNSQVMQGSYWDAGPNIDTLYTFGWYGSHTFAGTLPARFLVGGNNGVLNVLPAAMNFGGGQNETTQILIPVNYQNGTFYMRTSSGAGTWNPWVTEGVGAFATTVSGTTGTITGTALTATCDSGTASVTGAVVGHPVGVSSTTGADVGGAFNLRASVKATNTVTVYVCGTGTPASLAYNVTVF
jgi:hypothetical protein